MANGAALIRESIWRNREFRRLPRLAQCTYLQLCSQKDLDCAGILTLNVGVLAKGCDEINYDAVEDDLKALEAERFVFVDEDTDELFIRAYMRTAEVVKSPNVFKSALKSARMVESPKLRIEVAAELRRLNRVEADKAADELDPSGTVRPNHTNPSGTLSNSETLSEPSYLNQVPVPVSPSVDGSFGEDRPQCPKHQTNHDGPCPACKRRRDWDTVHAAQLADAAAAERRRQAQVRKDCELCDDAGWVLGSDPVIKCNHDGSQPDA